MREQGKLLRLSSERLTGSDDLVIICIPDWFRNVLLDLTERLLWTKVWTDASSNEITLSEANKQRIEYGIYKLSQVECDMEIINNNYINVTCGGCGSGGVPTTILCYDQDGNPIVTPQPPVDPTVPAPIGDEWPVDPFVDEPPAGFDDWTTFDIEACAAANGIWQAAYALVVAAEGGIDLIATVAAVLVFLLPLILGEIVIAIGGASLLELGYAIAQILLSEQASDILNEARLWMETEKQNIICTIFRYRHDIPTMRIELVRSFYAWVDATLTLDDEEQQAVREYGRSFFPLNLLLSYMYEYQRYIDASDPIDCSLCALDYTWYVNVGNGDGSLSIIQSGQDKIWFEGLTPKVGGVEIRGYAAPIPIMPPTPGTTALAVEFFVHRASSTLGAADVSFRCFNVGIMNIDVVGITDERILLHRPNYAGPLTGYDRVFQSGSAGQAWTTLFDENEIATSAFGFRRVAASQAQSNVVCKVSQIIFRDINGDPVQV